MKKRIICPGDVHGCVTEFKQLLDKVNYDPLNDEVVLLGDLVHRGPESQKTVQFVREMGFKSIMGNHDEQVIRYNKHQKMQEKNPEYKIPMRYFGEHKLEIQRALTEEDFEFLKNLPYYIQLPGNWVVVHAGLENNLTLPQQDHGHITHLRYVDAVTFKKVSMGENFLRPPNSLFWTERYAGPHNIIYGHTVFQEPKVCEHSQNVKTIGIDTGCCFGMSLSCAILEEDGTKLSFESVPAEKQYWKPFSEWE